MATVIFVHGTGVRSPEYEDAFSRIAKELKSLHPDFTLKPCLWGNDHGAKLLAKGGSVPLYDSTLGLENIKDEDYETALWSVLYQDPLYELRALALGGGPPAAFAPNQRTPGQALEARLKAIDVPDALLGKVTEAGVGEAVFKAALTEVIASAPLHDALASASDAIDSYYAPTARAIVAQSALVYERLQSYPLILDPVLRDEIVWDLSRTMGDATLRPGFKNWIGKQFVGLALKMGIMNHVQRRRGAITDATYPAAGDILLYQARGGAIRDFIRARIEEAEPPVILLAHSLGGIACVDLLVMENLPNVKMLVTAGSQAPFLYEINALHSLAFGEPLPEHFPRSWLNIYNLKDFLSYVGGAVFPQRVQDVLVESKQPFPHSHSDYWNNRATWKAISTYWDLIQRQQL